MGTDLALAYETSQWEEALRADAPLPLPQTIVQPLRPFPCCRRPQAVPRLLQRLRTAAAAHAMPTFGEAYHQLTNEFHPLLDWACRSWDYLLATEGCRFIPRRPEEKWGAHGDYRAVGEHEYQRLVFRIFRERLLAFHQDGALELPRYLAARFWPAVTDAYRQLENPPDPRQRRLTAYSYLRCVPYRFFNDYHETLVAATLNRLPWEERQVLRFYFLHFLTEEAVGDACHRDPGELVPIKAHALSRLLAAAPLVHALLLQIERY